MAGGDDHKAPPSNPWEPVILIVGALAVGAFLIWQRGGFASLKENSNILIRPPTIITPPPQQ